MADLHKWDLKPESVYLVRLMTAARMAKSNSEARKLIAAGAVELDGRRIADPDYEFSLKSGEEKVLKVGKRRFLRIRA